MIGTLIRKKVLYLHQRRIVYTVFYVSFFFLLRISEMLGAQGKTSSESFQIPSSKEAYPSGESWIYGISWTGPKWIREVVHSMYYILLRSILNASTKERISERSKGSVVRCLQSSESGEVAN